MSPEIAKSCNARVAEFCKRYQTQEGFLKAKADENAAQMCGVTTASVKAAQCPKAAQSGSLAFLGAYCPVEAKPIAQEHCAGRDYTSKMGGKYARFCDAYLAQRRFREAAAEPAQKATDQVKQGVSKGIDKLKGLFGTVDAAARPRRRLPCLAGAAHAVDDPYPWIASAYVVKRDGVVLWAGQPDARLAPASLAKMMTALLALERGRLDEPVTVGRGVLQATGTRIGLKPGEQADARATCSRRRWCARRTMPAGRWPSIWRSVKDFRPDDERPRRHARPGQHALRRSLRP